MPVMAGHVARIVAYLAFLHLTVADVPKVDFDRMGTVALAGAFAGLDLYSSNANNTFDPSSSTLVSRASNGSLTTLGETNSGGSINALCSLQSILYLAGNFSSVSGTSLANIASYDVSSRQFAPLGAGLDAPVDALFCDSASGKVWAGGKFKAPVGGDSSLYGGSVAIFDTKASSWSSPAFYGLSGPSPSVNAIVPSSSGSSLYFGGSFQVAYGSNNTQAINGTNNPSVPYSSGATPFSSSLVPIPLSAPDVNASPSSSLSGFSDIGNVLCPTGDDGPNHSWFTTDGMPALISVRTNKFASARGIRLGNTFVDGHSTNAFKVVSIPQNQPLTLTYIDPNTKANSTCTSSCPLLSDSGVPYQDFLFDESTSLTGVQITLTGWTGASAGLHLLQLLSDGAFASAISDDNGHSCYAPEASTVYKTGDWKVVSAGTTIAGTTQSVLVANVAVGTSASSAPTLTWYPYVSASGSYNVYVYIPGCVDFQDCASRTSVKITVTPGGTAAPVSTTISQRVNSDTRQLVYSGFIVPAPPMFTSAVQLALADEPQGSGQNGQYDIIADRVQFELVSLNSSVGSGGSPGQPLGPGSSVGFGFFEWPIQNATSVNATGVIGNTSETTFETVSAQFASSLGSFASAASVNALAVSSDSVLFLGGSFTGNTSNNIAVFRDGALGSIAGNGLNGVVHSLVIANGSVFAGGEFTDTFDKGNPALSGVAMYNIASDSWTALSGGVNGVVSSLEIQDGLLIVAGNFTEVYTSSDNIGSAAGGVATWNLKTNEWTIASALIIGSTSLTYPGSDNSLYIAGNLVASSAFSAAGWAIIETGKNGQPSFTSTSATGLAEERSSPVSSSAPPSTPSSTSRRRRGSRHGDGVVAWLVPRLRSVFPRQSSSTPSSLPATSSTPGPSVFAGAFWTNSSSSHETIILGGNFSFSASSARSNAVALYDSKTETLSSLQGDEIEGVVYSLLVSNNDLYVGGTFTLSGSSGFAIYDLSSQKWDSVGQSLSASSGSVVVRSVTTPPSNPKLFVVAGSFSAAGSLPCQGICSWDSSRQQWSALGSGIKGKVASVDYSKGDSDVLIAAGSLTLSDGTSANVAKYFFANSTWTAVGSDIPGPVTAVRINDQDLGDIFAAGRSSDGSAPFLVHWDGSKWNSLGDTLTGATSVSQLQLLPLQDDHSANSIVPRDRVLLITGSLVSDSFGNVSTALYDGQTFYPYISSTSLSGGPGVVAGLFHSLSTFNFTTRHFLATGVVILISIAIAAGIVFFMLLIGVLYALFARETPASDPKEYADQDEDDTSLHRPSSLLAHINAATRSTIIGNAALAGATARAGDGSRGSEEFGGPSTEADHDGSGWRRSETPAVASGAVGGAFDQDEEEGRPAHARYSFDGQGEGELPLQTGAELAVLDDRDPAWWYVRDQQTGREGIVPAAYLY